jgi:NTE family protein
VIAQTIDVMEREILRHQILAADLVIRPDVGHYSSIAYTGVEEIIALGERAGLDSVERIKELIADWEAKQ